MATKGILHKNKTLLSAWRDIRRRRLEQEQSRQALLTQLQQKKAQKEKQTEKLRAREQAQLAQSAFSKLTTAHTAIHKREYVEQLLRVMHQKRLSLRHPAAAETEFQRYPAWKSDLAALNTNPAEPKITMPEIHALFIHWDTLREKFGKTHPTFFNPPAQVYEVQPPVDQLTRTLELRTKGAGPTFSTTVLPQQQKVRPREQPPRQKKTPAPIQAREEVVRTRKEKKALKRHGRRH